MGSSPTQVVAKSHVPPWRTIQKYDKVKIKGSSIKSEHLADRHHPHPPDSEGIVMEVNTNETPSTAKVRVTIGLKSTVADPVMTVPIFSLSFVDSIMSDSGELDAQKLDS